MLEPSNEDATEYNVNCGISRRKKATPMITSRMSNKTVVAITCGSEDVKMTNCVDILAGTYAVEMFPWSMSFIEDAMIPVKPAVISARGSGMKVITGWPNSIVTLVAAGPNMKLTWTSGPSPEMVRGPPFCPRSWSANVKSACTWGSWRFPILIGYGVSSTFSRACPSFRTSRVSTVACGEQRRKAVSKVFVSYLIGNVGIPVRFKATSGFVLQFEEHWERSQTAAPLRGKPVSLVFVMDQGVLL